MSEIAPEAAPVAEEIVQQPASSAVASESFVAKVEEKVVDIFEAAARLVGLVEGHRTAGDREVAEAIADVKSVLPADPVEAPAEAPAAEAQVEAPEAATSEAPAA